MRISLRFFVLLILAYYVLYCTHYLQALCSCLEIGSACFLFVCLAVLSAMFLVTTHAFPEIF